MVFSRNLSLFAVVAIAVQTWQWSVGVSSIRSLATTETKGISASQPRPPIYTYDSASSNTNADVIDLWKQAWSDAGWDPIVLTLDVAKKHKAYETVRSALMLWGGVRALQWLAVAQVGGGWYSDYEVFPLHDFRNDTTPHGGQLTVWENVIPSLVSGSSAEYGRGALLLANNVKESDGSHSDILALLRLGRVTTYNAPTFDKERKVITEAIALQSDSSSCFNQKRAVHFTTSGKEGNKKVAEWLARWDKSECSADLPRPAKVAVADKPSMESSKQPPNTATATLQAQQLTSQPRHLAMLRRAQREYADFASQATQQIPVNTDFATGPSQLRSATHNVRENLNFFPQGAAQLQRRTSFHGSHLAQGEKRSLEGQMHGASQGANLNANQQPMQHYLMANPTTMQSSPQVSQNRHLKPREGKIQGASQGVNLNSNPQPMQQHVMANPTTIQSVSQNKHLRQQQVAAANNKAAASLFDSSPQQQQMLQQQRMLQQLQMLQQQQMLSTTNLTPKEQQRILKMRLQPLEWNSLVRAAFMDDNLVNQLARRQQQDGDIHSTQGGNIMLNNQGQRIQPSQHDQGEAAVAKAQRAPS